MGIAEYLEMKNREKIRRARREDAKKVSVGLFLGAAIGGACGLLFAPQSGEKTREDLANAAKDAAANVKNQANDALEVVKTQATGVFEAVKSKTNEVVEKAKQTYEDHVDSKLTDIGPAIDLDEVDTDLEKEIDVEVEE